MLSTNTNLTNGGPINLIIGGQNNGLGAAEAGGGQQHSPLRNKMMMH